MNNTSLPLAITGQIALATRNGATLGHNLPLQPLMGMKFWVQTGSHWCIGTNYSIARVNSRSFYIRSEGTTRSRLLAEWQCWLLERMAEGIVFCDGDRLVSPLHGQAVVLPKRPSPPRAGVPAVRPPPLSSSPVSSSSQPMNTESTMSDADFTVELKARDLRFLRAAREVLQNYEIKRRSKRGKAGDVVVDVSTKGRAYEVTFRKDWSAPPACSCPDSQKGGSNRSAGFCKHTIASALKWDDLRCQLLDLLI